MRLILLDRFWFVHILFSCIIKFQFLAQLPVDLFPTWSCLVLYSLCASFIHSLIMWLIVSSSSPYNLKYCVLSILVYLLRFPFRNHVQVFSCEISVVIAWITHTVVFLSISVSYLLLLLLLLFCLPLLSALFRVTVISFFFLFRVLVLMHPRNLQYWWVLFLLLFLTHTMCLYYHSDVRFRALSSNFLSSGPLVWVFPLSFLRMISSILQRRLLRWAFLWWDFSRRVWFEKFSRSFKGTFFLIFLSFPLV